MNERIEAVKKELLDFSAQGTGRVWSMPLIELIDIYATQIDALYQPKPDDDLLVANPYEKDLEGKVGEEAEYYHGKYNGFEKGKAAQHAKDQENCQKRIEQVFEGVATFLNKYGYFRLDEDYKMRDEWQKFKAKEVSNG